MPLVVPGMVGIGLGIPGLTTLLLKLLDEWKSFFRAMKTAERDGELLYTRFDHLTQRYIALQAVLFEEGKFDFVQGTVFQHLPADQQIVLKSMFLELARLLYAFLKLRQSRNISLVSPSTEGPPFDITLSPEQITELFAETEVVPRHGNPKLRMSWRDFSWAASNKKHVETLMEMYEDWLKRIRETMEDFWWPLSFFDKFSNLEALESDKDFETSGMVAHSRLRKLLLDDSPFRPTLELKGPLSILGELQDTSLPLRKIGNLDGQKVFVEIMPYKVDKYGFMPGELRRRFCAIAALLNTQEVDDLKVLHCLYWRHVQEYDGSFSKTSFQLISSFPPGSSSEFKTLAEIIRSFRGNKKPSFDSRLGICHVLAQTISQCMSVGWRHRNIRSRNVLFFFDEADLSTASDKVFGGPILCGFEESRLQDDYSMKTYGDNTMGSKVYRHPQRWGQTPADYNGYHDLYSFGVILLEVGLWEPVLSALQRYSGKKSVDELTAEEVRIALLKASKDEAEHKCGSRYGKMVEMCLKSDFGLDKRPDTDLQTNLQVVFRQDILEALLEEQMALTAKD
ncbi:hypothetical protein N431DRAFT_485650 [Stipitochalara longipes BDJ]|nr:hypothetical protein N431DRAFT_485650 [Stipitochalara longipes BDJ]